MWISKALSKDNTSSKAEKGKITLSSTSQLEVSSAVNARNLNSYAPFGYSFAVPVGEEVLLVPSSDGQAALGTKMTATALENGEVCISSQGGAKIVLKNDGSVIINSLTIDKNGVIKQ